MLLTKMFFAFLLLYTACFMSSYQGAEGCKCLLAELQKGWYYIC
jgi:hypothetical protein